MHRALLVVDPIDPTKQFVKEAGEIVDAVGAEFLLLHVTSESEYNETQKALNDLNTSEGGSYGVSQAEAGAKQLAEEVGRDVFGADGPSFESVGRVGDTSSQVLKVAEDRECDHIFIAGRKRSPSGKAIFGDAAQRVILNSSVPVTVTTYED
ncbi:universal stress protein [Saliphagus sp. GCM10025334]